MVPKRIHITPDGPKECSTTEDKCRYSTHFEGNHAEEAQNFYEKERESNLVPVLEKPKGAEAPKNGSFSYPEIEEVYEILERKHLKKEALVGYGVYGSFMRNLDTPNSDRDLTVFVGGSDLKRPVKTAVAGGDDVAIEPVELIAAKSYGFYEQLADLRKDNGSTTLLDSSYRAYLRGIRPSIYMASDSKVSSSITNFKVALKQKDPERAEKYLKRSLVDLYCHKRIDESILLESSYDPRFSDTERKDFYSTLDDLKRSYRSEGLTSVAEKFSSISVVSVEKLLH